MQINLLDRTINSGDRNEITSSEKYITTNIGIIDPDKMKFNTSGIPVTQNIPRDLMPEKMISDKYQDNKISIEDDFLRKKINEIDEQAAHLNWNIKYNKNSGEIYFYDPTNKSQLLKMPIKVIADIEKQKAENKKIEKDGEYGKAKEQEKKNNPEEGRTKKLITRTSDGEYVVLMVTETFNKNEMERMEQAKKENHIAKQLAGYSAFLPSFYVTLDILIAKNGGVDTLTHLDETKKPFNIIVTKAFVTQIDELLEKGIIPIDMKPDNLLYDKRESTKEDEKIKVTDTNEYIILTYNRDDKFRFTEPYVTAGLLHNINNGDTKVRTLALKASVNFATLHSLMIMTGRPELVRLVPEFKGREMFGVDPAHIHKKFFKNSPPYNVWIKSFILKKYRKEVKEFLKNPSEKPLQGKLGDMIRWNKN